ncbi:platelet-activating factor receptor [Anguilla rostrata]|uniref:platelet-activating factor receptor n=1 Tax=Anguilla rostrata TaxID=7938 RepID=UPI0030D1D921
MAQPAADSLGNDSGVFLDSEFRYALFPAFYGVVFAVGLVANASALFVLRRLRDAKAMNEIRIYMTNLTVADLLFVCVLPFWIGYYARRGDWVFGEVLCRITGSMFFVNTYSSVLFLAIISFNRYWAVTQPLDAAASDHRRRGILVSLVVWAVTVGTTVPHLAEPGLNRDFHSNATRCFEHYQQREEGTKRTVLATHFVIVGLFFLVFLLVAVCNVLIGRTLLAQRQTQAGRKRWGLKKYALWMVCVVVLVFVVCFVPHHLVQGPWAMAVLEYGDLGPWARQRLNDAHQVTQVLMGLNCILDPVVYCFSTRKFRRYVAGQLRCFGKASRDCVNHTASTAVSLGSQRHAELVPMGTAPKA